MLSTRCSCSWRIRSRRHPESKHDDNHDTEELSGGFPETLPGKDRVLASLHFSGNDKGNV